MCLTLRVLGFDGEEFLLKVPLVLVSEADGPARKSPAQGGETSEAGQDPQDQVGKTGTSAGGSVGERRASDAPRVTVGDVKKALARERTIPVE